MPFADNGIEQNYTCTYIQMIFHLRTILCWTDSQHVMSCIQSLTKLAILRCEGEGGSYFLLFVVIHFSSVFNQAL